MLGLSSLVYLELPDDRKDGTHQAGVSSGASVDRDSGPQPTTRRGSAGTNTIQTTQEDTSRETKVSRERPGSQGDAANGKEQGETDEFPVARELESGTREILSRYPGSYGVVLWQPESGTRISLDAGKRFRSASLAKLPALLALYREAAKGRLSLDERIELSASDIQPGTGVLQNRPPGTAMTLRECAEYLIKESDNTAWAMLERRLGERRVHQELSNLGTVSTNYEYGSHLTSPADVLRMLGAISDPAYTSPALSREMLASMTNTAFEGWLPQGLPERARIAHKIGTLGDSFADAGVVYPPQGRGETYYIVVMSEDTGSEAYARDAMQKISRKAYRSLVDPSPDST